MNARRNAAAEPDSTTSSDNTPASGQSTLPANTALVQSGSCFDDYDSFIINLLDRLSVVFQNNSRKNNSAGAAAIRARYLSELRDIFQSYGIYFCRLNSAGTNVTISADPQTAAGPLFAESISALEALIEQCPRPRYTTEVSMEIDVTSMQFILAPLDPHEAPDTLLIFQHQQEPELKPDITIGVILQGLYKGTQAFSILPEKKLLQIVIADELKSAFRFVSNRIYTYRYELFLASLNDIEMYFEPIIQFDKMHQGVTIFGWEALARHKDKHKAPFAIFEAAELWGWEFQTALDLYCLKKALKTYHRLNTNLRNTRYGEARPLTVNVFPNSVLHPEYGKLLTQLLESERLLAKNKLILEISEKTLIQASTSSEESRFLKQFQKVINNLRRRFGLNFAIDDFGVGYSSIARLNKLLPGYVKIDRDILHYNHDLGKELIKYVNNVATKIPGIGINIIVEGLDRHSKIGLRELVCDLEIEYIQGHKFRDAQPKITNRLDKDMYHSLFRELNWPLRT